MNYNTRLQGISLGLRVKNMKSNLLIKMFNYQKKSKKIKYH